MTEVYIYWIYTLTLSYSEHWLTCDEPVTLVEHPWMMLPVSVLLPQGTVCWARVLCHTLWPWHRHCRCQPWLRPTGNNWVHGKRNQNKQDMHISHAHNFHRWSWKDWMLWNLTLLNLFCSICLLVLFYFIFFCKPHKACKRYNHIMIVYSKDHIMITIWSLVWFEWSVSTAPKSRETFPTC